MIRSLTIGLPVDSVSQSNIEDACERIIKTSNELLKEPQYIPRTTRYTLPSIGPEGETEGLILSTVKYVDELARKTNVRWFCLPFDFMKEGIRRERLNTALDIISKFPKLFLNFIIADGKALSLPAINDVSSVICKIAQKSNSGFDNFRVGASCNCPSNAPFFPFSRHSGDSTAFSFALETTKIALEVTEEFESHVEIDIFRDRLVDKLSTALLDIQRLGEQIEYESGCEYRGLDASLAPFPDGHMSVGKLVERLLGVPIGSHGSVFITAFLTDAVRAALSKSGARSAGFNGVMYSLLEDNGLASANSRRLLNLNGLLALSCVCACGIDMVPIPGNSFPEEIAAVMADIASISIALKKPLGIRVLPIPGCANNEFTRFNSDFLCDSRVMGLSPTDNTLFSSTHSFRMLAPIK